jgi:predicted CopG family antitoxin
MEALYGWHTWGRMDTMARGKSIHVDSETHSRLAKMGFFGETFCDIIKRLLVSKAELDHIVQSKSVDDALESAAVE